MTWEARLLPFLEQGPLWETTVQAYQQDRDFVHNPPHVGLATLMPVYSCPADARTELVTMGVAFTAYLGVEGINQYTTNGILYLDSQVRLADVKDGTSNTLIVGERPPSADLIMGWWYAGWGQSKDGSGDSVLGASEVNTGNYAINCPPTGYQFGPGQVSNQCDAFHFWSLHLGGANFAYADASVHFVTYGAAPIIPQLCTRNGGEVVEVP
jgi:prepilin-type processing-associated H-X9-DG protein